MNAQSRPILFAYDGSEQAKEAIRQAGRELKNGRRAIVLTVWQPMATIPFARTGGAPPISPDLESQMEHRALGMAKQGADLARATGFEADAIIDQGNPIWERIVHAAEEHNAGIVVMGSNGRTGIPCVLMGSVATATALHTKRPVLIGYGPAMDDHGGG